MTDLTETLIIGVGVVAIGVAILARLLARQDRSHSSTQCLRCRRYFLPQLSKASMPGLFCQEHCQIVYMANLDKMEVWRG